MKILYRYLNLELAIPILWLMIGLIGILSFFDFSSFLIYAGLGIYILVKNIEKRRLMEDQIAQADKLASIGELSSGVAHEINNPLSYIKSKENHCKEIGSSFELIKLPSEVSESEFINKVKELDKLINAFNDAVKKA